MSDFWTNILRYPRFFISSLIGLLIVIITPFRNLFKNTQSRVFLIIFILLFLFLLYIILKSMLAV